jgi:hypothetical protein
VFRLVAVAVALVLWFALACVIVPRIVPPIVELWERLDLRITLAAEGVPRPATTGRARP